MPITLRGDADSDFSNGIDISGTDIELNDDGTASFGDGDVNIDDSGRLLVGTDTARTNFFNNPTTTIPLQIEGTGTPSAGISAISNPGAVAGNTAAVVLGKTRGSSVGSTTIVASGDELGVFSFQGSDGSEFIEAARITGIVDGTPGTDDMPGRLSFFTTPDGTSTPTEKMRICSGSSNLDLIYINCTGRINNAPNTVGGHIIQGNGNTKIRSADNQAVFQFYSTTGEQGNDIGNITVGTTSTSYNTTSDYRLKENVTAVTDGITRLQQLKPSRFNFIADPDKTVDGFLAHEAQAVVPECVTGTKDAVDADGNPEYQGIDQSKLVPLLTAALQEAITRIETLESRLSTLEGGNT